jgi:hypothetical protein
MVYASGRSLSQRLSDWPQRLLPQERVRTILAQAGQALRYLHEQHMTHGNLSTSNVLFDAQGEVLLADYALALAARQPSGTATDVSSYLAPEQQHGGESTPASDQYALGCLAYELCSGQPPFVIFSPKITNKLYRTRALIPPRRHNPLLPEYIEQAILKAMAADPYQRYGDVQAFLGAMGAWEVPAVAVDVTGRRMGPVGSAMNSLMGRTEKLAIVQNLVRGWNAPDDARASIKQRLVSRNGGQPKNVRLLMLVVSLLIFIGLVATLFTTLGAFVKAGGQPPLASTQVVSHDTPVTRSPTVIQTQTAAPQPTEVATVPVIIATPEVTATPEVIATPSPVPTETPQATPTPTAIPTPTLDCTVTATRVASWGGGFSMSVKIRNTGTQPIHQWQLVWTFDGDQMVTSTWNASFDQEGKQVTLHYPSRASDIAAGKSLSVGANVLYRRSNQLPTVFTLNGTVCH